MTDPANPTPGIPTRRIVANFFASLDGVVEAPHEWHFPWFDEEMGAVVDAGITASDTLLMGATLYREWSEYWPTSTDQPFADLMNGRPKYVVSDSLERADWTNSTLIRRADATTRLRELKAAPGKDIAMSGSATLMRWLLQEGLLDELNLLVHPVALGHGRRLFEGVAAEQRLELITCTPFHSGVVHLTYRPTRS